MGKECKERRDFLAWVTFLLGLWEEQPTDRLRALTKSSIEVAEEKNLNLIRGECCWNSSPEGSPSQNMAKSQNTGQTADNFYLGLTFASSFV